MRLAYANEGDLDRAIADFSEAIRLDPSPPAAFDDRGLAYRDKNDLDKAWPTSARHSDSTPKRAAYRDCGSLSIRKREFDRAIADYTEATRLDPSEWRAYLGRLRAAPRRFLDGAIEDYTAVIKRDPRSAAAHEYRGSAYAEKGDLDNGVADFSRVHPA